MNLPPLDAGTREDAPWQAKLWNWKDIVLITFAVVGILLGSVVLLTYFITNFGSLAPAGESPSLLYYAGVAGLEALALLSGVTVFGLFRKRLDWRALGLAPTTRGWLWAAALVSVLAIPAASATATLAQKILGLPLGSPQMDFILPERVSIGGALAMLLFGGVVVPISEEIFFRGLLYTWMRQGLSAWLVLPINAAIFGLVHGDPAVAVASGILGLILGWFYERSRSLLPSILIHVLVNGLQLALIYLLVSAGIEIPDTM